MISTVHNTHNETERKEWLGVFYVTNK